MDIKDEKELIKKQVDEVEDVNLLKLIREILSYGKATHSVNAPLTVDDLVRRDQEAMRSVEQGTTIPHEDIVEYFRQKRPRG